MGNGWDCQLGNTSVAALRQVLGTCAVASARSRLATLAAGLPSRGEWLYELKFDGYRILTRFQHGKPALITRRGNDWSSKMPQLARELNAGGCTHDVRGSLAIEPGSGWKSPRDFEMMRKSTRPGAAVSLPGVGSRDPVLRRQETTRAHPAAQGVIVFAFLTGTGRPRRAWRAFFTYRGKPRPS
jgi:hypothetical protein